jgi:translation initiation factor IF-2
MPETKPIAEARPPIVAIVGHIDHGKSTLLDYIRKTNVVEGEAGGITQHLSAYEAIHTNASGEHHLTFLDTPGHEAFRAMRSRGLEAADVAVVVVSAEEGVKLQTLEALKLIEEVKIPFIVAFSKIDKPTANLERAKMSLLENNVFLEGMGGNIPFIPLSSKTGEGVPELLDLILLAAELEGLSSDPLAPGEGIVIEAYVDGKRGSTATLIIKNGAIESGEFVVAGSAIAPVRIMENFLGKPIKEARAGSTARIVGFSSLPQVGSTWRAVESKKEAERDADDFKNNRGKVSPGTMAADESPARLVVPILIKTDFAGTGEAVVHELEKLPKAENMEARVVARNVGTITEGDVRLVGGGQTPGIIAGFNVKVEREARELAERQGVAIGTFDIIYKLAEWLAIELETRRPRQSAEEKTGSAKILKIFSTERGRIVLGGRVEEGELREGAEVRVMRRDLELGRGEILSLQNQKKAAKKVEAGSEFGLMLKATFEPAAGDSLEAIEVVLK